MTETELVADLYRQIAFSAAILGGFTMTFLSVLVGLISNKSRMLLVVTVAMATAAVLLIVATLSSTLLVLSVQQFTLGFQYGQWPENLYRTKLIAEFCLLSGILGLLSGIGLSGYIRNIATGISTTLPALAGVALLVVVFLPTF